MKNRQRKITKIYKRNGKIVPFDREKIVQAIYKADAQVGNHDIKETRKLAKKVTEILENHFPKTIPSVEDIQEIVEKVLIENGHVETSKAYILYRQKRKELREKKEKKEIENIPYKTIWQVLVWNLEHSCETIEKLNRHIKTGTFPQLVKESEKEYNKKILDIVDQIKKNRNKIKLLIVAGPSSSGKTTTATRIKKELEKSNIKLTRLNIDEYFYNLEYQIKDEQGDYDFEGPYALDFTLINKHLSLLVKGKKIKVPQYDFKTGKRVKKYKEIRLKARHILLIDSHFGLYPKLTENIPRENKFGLYLETLCQLRTKEGRFVRWTDIRMLRRMIRDKQFRAYNPIQTVGHWHYVRKGELKNIIPYISEANYVLNTALPYELPVLKHYLYQYFPLIIKTYKKDTKREDAYIRAQRVYNLLKEVLEWKESSIIPKKSILREFIGI